ncbi:MAG: adenylate/guanylate cyclase domain-containing protein, partial [Cyclobacteriaceae bacterium]|nr:adenylate/guanylate cyclase domain-containing protein [Cyclobacteriaceae bacterium]
MNIEPAIQLTNCIYSDKELSYYQSQFNTPTMPHQRKLAAIMFTDIVGYTALMGEDEDSAYQLLQKNRQIQQPVINKHGGNWLKEMGDGNLASFSSAIDAVNCAKEIQQLSSKSDITLRIGIHVGDVTMEENDVIGDVVNIASRIESMADPGGIYISESVQKAVRGNKEIEVNYIGEVQ